ncbi:MAG: ABC transporter ATP-binding protein [Deltaproteobacteria bacterium]|jgi:ABC-type multidrug transport system ATPase subunit|nr:MAG: ABC transporter ATP-binding protein [Deltaproteobacteria bacterium]TNF25682.1 MAG: ABC transporter ATP-binding protein [Deltaproteobacteria bacterium]
MNFQQSPSFSGQRVSGVQSGLSKNLFRLEDVSIRFGSIQALSNVKLSIESGEVIFLTGASGAGKTTLLRVLSGDIKPDSGKVSIPSPKRCFISKVFQDLRLEMNKTCEQNLWAAYDTSIYENKKEFKKDLEELASVLGFDNRLDLKVKDANGGLKQKVAIARALLAKPDVFIADEPTASLDSGNARRLFEILNIYNVRKGMTVIWASHNKELVKNFSGRIIHLDNGKLIYTGHACFI